MRRPSQIAGLILVALGATAAADPSALLCDTPLLAVAGADAATQRRVCSAAQTALPQLATCGLTLTRPVTIQVHERIDGPSEHCAGLYTCGTDRIEILSPSAAAEIMPAGSIFAELPSDTYYDSLVVHELAHALVDQADCPGPGCDAGREYVAYALQIASLTQEGRDAVEAWRDIPRPVDEARLNDYLLYFKPDVFAAYAWAHFDGSGGGCDFVSRLMTGEISLALPEAFD